MTDTVGEYGKHDLFVVPHHVASTVGCGAYSVPISILPYTTQKTGAAIAHSGGQCLTPVDVTVDGTLCFPTALNTDAMNALMFVLAENTALMDFSQNISYPNFRHTHSSYKGVPGLLYKVKPAANDAYFKCQYSYNSLEGPAATVCYYPPSFNQTFGLSFLPTNIPFVVPILPSNRNGSILKLRFNGQSDPNALSFNWLLGTAGQWTNTVQTALYDFIASTITAEETAPLAAIEIQNRNPVDYSWWDWRYGLTSICIPYTQTLHFNEVSATLTTNFPSGYSI